MKENISILIRKETKEALLQYKKQLKEKEGKTQSLSYIIDDSICFFLTELGISINFHRNEESIEYKGRDI